jgi:hypothetical protein
MTSGRRANVQRDCQRAMGSPALSRLFSLSIEAVTTCRVERMAPISSMACPSDCCAAALSSPCTRTSPAIFNDDRPRQFRSDSSPPHACDLKGAASVFRCTAIEEDSMRRRASRRYISARPIYAVHMGRPCVRTHVDASDVVVEESSKVLTGC